MLFTPSNAKKVMSGQKTQTRRPETEHDRAERDANGNITAVYIHYNDIARHLKWQVGKTYAVQPGRGKPAIGRMKLLSIRRERVNEINRNDAIAEGITEGHNGFFYPGGYDNVPELAFRDLWDSIYSGGMAFETGPMVWVLEFEVSR